MANKHKRRRSSLDFLSPKLKSSRIAGALSIFILLAILGFKESGDALYNFDVNPGTQQIPNDAIIVCLAGAKGRIAAAFDIYRQGLGTQLVIVGAGPKATLNTIMKTHIPDLVLSPEVLAKRPIYVETESRNTLENAIFIAQFLAKQPTAKNLVLITSGYHMKRARLMIQQNLREPVNIIPYLPRGEAIHAANWWGSYLGMAVTTEENIKLLLAKLLLPRI